MHIIVLITIKLSEIFFVKQELFGLVFNFFGVTFFLIFYNLMSYQTALL